jgi:hypothetical protein
MSTDVASGQILVESLSHPSKLRIPGAARRATSDVDSARRIFRQACRREVSASNPWMTSLWQHEKGARQVISVLLLRVSVVLALVGMVIGIEMGIKHDFALAPAHAHLNLLGFVSLFLFGLYYHAVPEAAASVLAKIQAWTAVFGAVVFPIGITAELLGESTFKFLVVAGAIIVFAGAALFAIVVFRFSTTHRA